MLTIEETRKSAYVMTDDFEGSDVTKLNALLDTLDTEGKGQAALAAFRERQQAWKATQHESITL